MDSITATTTHELSVPLRAWPASKPRHDSLPFLIARINEQKRSFRNVSEQSLEEEIQALEAGESQKENSEPLPKRAKAETTDSKTRKEEMLTARLEILQQASYVAFCSQVTEVVHADLKKAGADGELLWLGFCVPGALQAYSQTSRNHYILFSQTARANR